jgi:hypothetical protein
VKSLNAGHTAPSPRARSSGPTAYVRQDFFLGRRFRNIDDLDTQFDG